MAAACRCAFATHEDPRCPKAEVVTAQSSLYAGLYGSRNGAPPVRRSRGSSPMQTVRLLNPDFADDDDSAGRRFAQLEID